MKRFKAAILYHVNQPLQIEELDLPGLKDGQVLVKISFSGVCHSQLNEIKGKKGPDKFLPHTLGHEGAGVVEAVGRGVKKVKRGDPVVLTWIKGNGMDVPSIIYNSAAGQRINSGAISTFMEYAVVSENRVVPIPSKMPLKEACLLGCAFPTGAGIVMNTAQMKKGNSIAVFGVGGIGLSVVLAASSVKASPIIAVDVKGHKLEQAEKMGATQTINAQTEDVLAKILQMTQNKGVNFAVESAGQKTTMETAFACVKDNSGLCILAGNLPKGEKISIDPFDLIKGKRIVGTWGGETQPDRDIPKYAKMFLDGKLNLSELITHEYRFEDINQAFQDLEAGKLGRALVRMS